MTAFRVVILEDQPMARLLRHLIQVWLSKHQEELGITESEIKVVQKYEQLRAAIEEDIKQAAALSTAIVPPSTMAIISDDAVVRVGVDKVNTDFQKDMGLSYLVISSTSPPMVEKARRDDLINKTKDFRPEVERVLDRFVETP